MHTAVRMLGPPVVSFDGRTIEPPPSKVTAMLMYLAFAPGWVSRDDLIWLLWPDREESAARRNLRQLLHTLKDVEHARDVARERTRVRWDVEHDVQGFERALERGDLAAALAAYEGPFLDRLRVSGVPEFDAWVELERARLERAWRDASLERAGELASSGDPAEAERILSAVTRADALDEEAVRAWMRATAAAGATARALQGYERFAERLRDALGLDPSPRTTDLATALRTHGPTPSPRPPGGGDGRERGVRSPPTRHAELPFVGRDPERRELVAILEDASAPIVSIVAPGGMGKTRLAVAVASTMSDRFRDGVAFASLEDSAGTADAEAAVAAAVGLVLSGGRSVLEQLTAHLADRSMLLVLDNLEHLTSDLAWLDEIVERCRGVRVLVTSRERLRLGAERVVGLRGLATPDPAANDPGSYDAVRLFGHAARRTGHPFGEDPRDLEHAARIARAVGGMPLALALAAAWLRVLPLGQIADEVANGIELLQSDERDRVERHRSIAAVFEATWNRLRSAERDAWARLSVFEGSFTRAAAADVANVGLPMLLTLINKSVLMHDGHGRYAFHPLLRRFGADAAERLGLDQDVRRRHASYYLSWVAELEHDLKSEGQFEALQAIATDLANVRAAWRTAVRDRACALLAGAVMALAVFYRFRWSAYQPGGAWAGLCSDAARELEGDLARGGEPSFSRREAWTVLGRILGFAADLPDAFAARAARALGHAERAGDLLGQALAHLQLEQAGGVEGYRSHLEHALACFQALDDVHGQAVVHFDRGIRAVQAGHGDEAVASLRTATDLFRQARDIRMIANGLEWLARAHLYLGNLGRAQRCVDEAHQILAQLAIEEPLAETLTTRRLLALARGDLDEAERHQEAFIAYFERDGREIGFDAHAMRAYLAYRRGDLERAHRHALEATAWKRPRGADVAVAEISTLLARIDTRSGQRDRAHAYLLEAMDAALALDAPRLHVDVAIAAAVWLWHHGDRGEARRVLGWAARDRAIGVAGRWELQGLADEGCLAEVTDHVDPHEDLRALLGELRASGL